MRDSGALTELLLTREYRKSTFFLRKEAYGE